MRDNNDRNRIPLKTKQQEYWRKSTIVKTIYDQYLKKNQFHP